MTEEQKREELIDMVHQFRVPELHTFLVCFGDHRVRQRKNILQKKAIKLLWTKQRKKFMLYASKVRSIFEEMRRPTNEVYNYPSSSFAKYINLSYFDGEQRVRKKIPMKKRENSVDDELYPPDSYWSRCKNLDTDRISRITFVEPSFFRLVCDIVPIKPLVPNRERDSYFEHASTFSVPNNIWTDFNFSHQILLRMCVLNEEMLVQDSLPPKLLIWLNSQLCLLPQSSPIISKLESKDTADAPVDLTPYLCKYAVDNHLVIRWSSQYYPIYGICIQAMKRKPSDQLIEGLMAKGEQNPEISMKIINQNLNDDDDSEIAATSLKVSLICPLGKMLMSLPTRATTCNHLQCFDGRLFIKLNEVKSTWLCPVCNESCLYDNLVVDGYFMDILRSDRFQPGVKEVNLSADGSWESVKDNSSRKRSASPSQVPDEKKYKVETIDDEIEFLTSKEFVRKERHRSSTLPPQSTSLLSNDWSQFFKEAQTIDDSFKYYPSVMNNRLSTPSPLSSSSSSSSSSGCSWISNESADVTENTTAAVPIISNVRGNIPPKKDVLLVDLTESNSELENDENVEDDIRSVSSNSSDPISSFFCHLRKKLNDSPPIYDIDSD